MGQVLQAGAGQNPARQAAVNAGIPMTVPALTVNKVCLSGLSAIALADQLIRAGEFDVVVAGGQESMTQAPHLLPNSRTGTKYGDAKLVDAMAHDGLSDTFDQVAMGALTEQANSRYDLTREEQDAFAAESHQKAARAGKNGVFDEAVTPVLIPQRKGDPIEFRDDEGVRADTTVETLARLKPAFAPDGTITAGTASQISDGACAVVVMSAEKAAELGITPIAEIGAHGVVAGPDATLQSQPSRAVQRACEREGIDPKDLDLVELNEAFAAVGIVSTRELGIDPEKVNPNGGAIALGHPIGMSGARIALGVALELRRRGGGVGAAALAPHTGRAQVLGLTGSPGVGKSTSTTALVRALRASGKRVGVLAVDPSSPFSGGALLGDRVRMQDHAGDEGVYIRSMASRGHLGGLAWATPQALRVLDAAGCDVVLVETVGVGQSELEVASLADTTLVLLAPGMGDGIQAAKAGILEVADVLVVNKADRDGADQAVRDLRYMLSLGGRHSEPGHWRPPIVKTVASRDTDNGIDEVLEKIEAHRQWLESSGEGH